MTRRILCLHLPNWPIQRVLAAPKQTQHRSPGKSSPSAQTSLPAPSVPPPDIILALLTRDPRRGDLVVAASPAAAQAGVRVGMPLVEASALLDRAALDRRGGRAHQQPRRVGETHQKNSRVRADRRVGRASPQASAGSQTNARPPQPLLPHDPAADRTALARLAQHCERFSPLVGWETVQTRQPLEDESRDRAAGTPNFSPATGPDCLLLEITGIGSLFGGEDCLAGELLTDLRRFGYFARVAIASTIGAAWGAANLGPAQLMVQDSSDHFHCQPPSASFLLSTLPVGALRLPASTLALLAQLGVQHLSELLALPRPSLRSRFGEQLILRINQLQGAALETIVPHRPPPAFVEEWLLEYPLAERQTIARIVGELVERLARTLAQRREGALRLVCRLDCAPGQPLFLQVGLFRPSADPAHLTALVRMQLDQAQFNGAVGRVRLTAPLTARLENRQGLLFAGDEHQAANQFAQLIDRCSSRLGPRAVLGPELTADPLPEKAVRYRAGFNQRSKRKSPHRSAPLVAVQSPLRPLAVYSPPVPLPTISIAPGGPPLSFEWAGQRHQIVHHSGPERIETGWWRGQSVCRDYWRVETTTGHRFWLFRQLDSGRWSLHGTYA